MTAIVVNTLNGAVTEYDGFDFHAVTPTHAGSHTGLYLFGGTLDVTAKIVSRIVTGKTLLGDSLKKMVDAVYFSLRGRGKAKLLVVTDKTAYSYDFTIVSRGVSRAYPGKGIRENYLAFGFTNPDGTVFELDQIEATVGASRTRRI